LPLVEIEGDARTRKRMMTAIDTPAGRVSALADGPPDAPGLILGHGAGAGIRSDFMEFVASELAARAVRVMRFNFAYIEARKKTPDRQPVLEATYGAVVEHVRREERPQRLFLGGKSLGGRIASHVVAGGLAAGGLVFLGYPLHPPGRPDRLRSAHLNQISVPMLFVEGTRDPFCPLETLEKVGADFTAPVEIAVIDNGDHSLRVRKSSGRSTEEAWGEAVEQVANWIKRQVSAED
jgi:predicted alpha/beta-hydrolase family hydrolase